MNRHTLVGALIFGSFATVLPFCHADESSQPVTAEQQSLPPSLAPILQASGELQQMDSSGPPQPEQESWTGQPLVNESSYFRNGNGFWASADLLLWGIKPGNTPPLLTSGTTTSLGAIGPGTTVLYGGDQDYDTRLGGAFTIGTWLNPERTHGIEASYFFLGGPSEGFLASSDGSPGSNVLARPYINAITGLPSSQLIGFPDITSGTGQVTSGSLFQGAQLNAICNLCCSCCENCCSTGCTQTGCGQAGYGGYGGYGGNSGYRVDMIAGFRYLNLNEDLVITENITFLPTAPSPPFDPGATIVVTDSFETRNDFYGGQIGARGEWYRGAWFTNVTGKVALGNTHQQVRINGSSVFTSSTGTTVVQPGGLLALPTNIGDYSRDQFTVVPEIGFNVGRQLTNNLRVYVGYNFIYWSSVVRPGDQIDPVINPTQLPTSTGPGTLVGPARPAFAFNDTDFWAHGINIGMEFRR